MTNENIGLNPEFFINPENIVREIGVEMLIPYPRQQEIYGDDEIEDEFVASIKDRGILTPLAVTPSKDDGFFEIISGHRRRKGAIKAAINTVPCFVKKYENVHEKELEFLMYNIQREKTKRTRIMEFIRYKQILCQIGKVRKGKGIYDNTIFENRIFSRILEEEGILEKIEVGKPLNSVDILKDITGFSKYEQEQLNIINEDAWFQVQLRPLEDKLISKEGLDQLWAQYWNAREQFGLEKATMNETVKAIKLMLKEVEDFLDDEERKKKKIPKQKKEKNTKEKKEKPPKKNALLPIGLPCTFSESPMKFSENNSTADFCFKHQGISFGVIRSINFITGFAVKINNDTFMIKPEDLADFLINEYQNR